MPMETKVAPQAVKDIDAQQGIVIAYPSVFGVLDDQGDIVEPGAFQKTIAEWGPAGKNRIKALYQHEPSWPVGRPVKILEDAHGLYTETAFAKTPLARDVLSLVQDGVITELSIGYDPVKTAKGERGERLLKEVRLWEYSFVTFAALDVARVVGVKGTPSVASLKERMARFEKALRDGRFVSDEVPHMLQLALEQWRAEAERLERIARALVPSSGKPFGPYEDFDDCVRRNQDKESPEGFCAWLHFQITGEWPGQRSVDWEREVKKLFDKHGGQVTLALETVERLCPATARAMRERGETALVFSPKAMPPQLLEGLCDYFSPDPGLFARCMESSLGDFDPSDQAAFCAWLHYQCTGMWPGEHRSAASAAEVKEGRVLSQANAQRVQNAIVALEDAARVLRELLELAEPPKKGTRQGCGCGCGSGEPGMAHSLDEGDLVRAIDEIAAWARKERLLSELRRFSESIKRDAKEVYQ